VCLEGFLYGNIFVLCALTCTLAKVFPGLGLYSGIFAIYLQRPSNKSRSRTANVVFCVICLLYVLSTATLILDSLRDSVSNNSTIRKNIVLSSVVQLGIIGTLSPQLQIDSQSIVNQVVLVQNIVNACCDFTTQSIIVRINHSSCIYPPFKSL
jgi:hypothetical protein